MQLKNVPLKNSTTRLAFKHVNNINDK